MYTDQQLLHSLQARDIDAFRFLYKKYSPALWGMLVKETSDVKASEQLMQSVFMNIWHNIAEYNQDKCRLFTWMYQLVQIQIKNLQTADRGLTAVPKKSLRDYLFTDRFKLKFFVAC